MPFCHTQDIIALSLLGKVQERTPAPFLYLYLMVTFAPTSAIFAAILSASSLETASLIALGASSTTAFASFRPRPVSSRTTLITLILLGPTAVRTASNSVCSSTGAAAGAASAAAGAAAAATGA